MVFARHARKVSTSHHTVLKYVYPVDLERRHQIQGVMILVCAVSNVFFFQSLFYKITSKLTD